MKILIAWAVFLVLFVAAAVWADRTVIFDSARVSTFSAKVEALVDGGCSLEVCASVKQRDGGTGYTKCTDPADLSGAPQTRCLQLLNSADTAWKNAEGL